jgi:hypothetical protein
MQGARFSVSFYIQSGPPFSAVDLARTIIRFTGLYRIRHQCGFNLLGLSFSMGLQGVYGVLLFGGEFAPVYEAISADSRNKYKLDEEEYTATIWPRRKMNRHLICTDIISKVIDTCR